MKKKLFPVLIVLVLLVVGWGFYRGWFALSSPGADKGSNKVNLNLSVDPDKMKEDAEAVKKTTTDLTGKATEQVKGSGEQAKDGK